MIYLITNINSSILTLPALLEHAQENKTSLYKPSFDEDEMISRLLQDGYDTVIAAHRETGSMWYERSEKNFERIDKGDIPREFKEKALVGIQGLCCVTHPEFIRNNSLLGKKIGLFEVTNQLGIFEVRTKQDRILAEKLIKNLIV